MRVTVMGLGRFGGGAGVTRWCLDRGHDVVLTDRLPAEDLRAQLEPFEGDRQAGRLHMRLGEHRLDDFTETDVVIASPAVPRPWENIYLRAALDARVPITTEIRLLVDNLSRRQVIGVTGSAGKSTTAAMIHHILQQTGRRSHLGGNIGGSLLNQLDAIRSDDRVVLELSSFMLYWLGEHEMNDDAPGWSPGTAVLTNITPNHLDWHRDMACYEYCKHNIFRFQMPGDRAIRPGDVDSNAPDIRLHVPGAHNQRNALLATMAVATGETSPDDAERALGSFPGLAHRLQFVGGQQDVRVYNDSKSTTPEATALAISAFQAPERLHVVVGGYDKGADFTVLIDALTRVAHAYAIGATGSTIAGAASLRGARATNCETLERAIAQAHDRLRPGDILLLSPGCASWDQFVNFEERGDRFVELVREMFAMPRPRCVV